ncbi:leucine--tRNA ligase [Thermogymnomonas acidicola]|uniref:Leucine--tRNA ligase n=1 Tax=Thermogymnomonas acidicola TaxID=399579 RepID=A0AA37BUC4_9ARCH|nr:leucine--tRNA ligase [Thermogymnomonas acidicola]GGM78389.1 leucine--tRNA ligase [Thermogymnomonas acidicola]
MDPEIERKWQRKWAEARLFEPHVDASRPKFLITVPWPYTNGSLHVGHGRTYTLADIIARYKRTRGFNVLFPMAFHQSGTPIIAFSERLRNREKKIEEQYISYLREYEDEGRIPELLEKFQDPKAIADYFSNAIVNDFSALGYSIDWTRRFTSADEVYQDFVKWQFEKLNSMGYIKQGSHPVLYSVRDENAVGEDDIADGDVDKVTIEEFTGVIFSGRDFDIVAASLRPETIFGITNLWISPSAQYVLMELEGRRVVVSREASEKLGYQYRGARVIRPVEKAEVMGASFRVPITGREVPVLESAFVDPDNGTGIVYSVPGHSIWDHVALRESGADMGPIKIISVPEGSATVESLETEMHVTGISEADKLREATQRLYRDEFYNGKMLENCGEFSGLPVKEARERVRERLLSSGSAIIVYETSRKAETRSGSKVVVAVLQDQWFIDYSVPEWKEASHRLIDSMLYVPEYYAKLMHEAVDWLRERPCARRRGLGTRLPFDERWVIESLSDSTIYPIVYTNIRELVQIREILGSVPYDLMDYIYGYSGIDGSRYDSRVIELARRAREQREYWYGVDIRLTAFPHLSNHLAFYIMNHSALFRGRDLPKGLIITGLVVSNGAKISKSKGNVVSLLTISRKYSADIYRLYVAVNADISTNLDWNETDVSALRKKYEMFVDLMENFRPTEGEEDIDRWFVSRFYMHMRAFIDSMEQYSIRNAYVQIFYEVLNDIRRYQTRGGDVNRGLGKVLRDWLICMMPAIPHTCEEYWHRLVKDSFVSTERIDVEIDGRIDWGTIESEDYLDRVVEDIRSILKATSLKPKRIVIGCHSQRARRIAEMILSGRQNELDREERSFIPDFMKNRKNISLLSIDEAAVLERNRKYLEGLFSTEVVVTVRDLSPRGKNPWPGRPAIVLEE